MHPKIKSVFCNFNILAVMCIFYVLPSDTKSTFTQFYYTEKLFVEFTLFAKLKKRESMQIANAQPNLYSALGL